MQQSLVDVYISKYGSLLVTIHWEYIVWMSMHSVATGNIHQHKEVKELQSYGS